jgi:hypothetical protein
MKRLFGVAAGVIALGLPALAQSPSVASTGRLVTIAYAQPQDRDQDRDRDRDRDRRGDKDRDRGKDWNEDRDRQWHRNHDRDRDHDKDWDRSRDQAWHRNNTNYRHVLAPPWQQKYDSYYQRWQRYRATNNQSEMRSMEKRMNSIRDNYRIPPDVPYGEIASSGGRY